VHRREEQLRTQSRAIPVNSTRTASGSISPRLAMRRSTTSTRASARFESTTTRMPESGLFSGDATTTCTPRRRYPRASSGCDGNGVH
jgi:hypothetical protein